jgi:hydroxyethylthiazole kinase
MPAEGDEMHAPASELPTIAADILARLRERRPRVHCITNSVAQNFTANLLLAAGATPSMTVAPEEMASFVATSEALLVNLGMFDTERREAIEIGIEEAMEEGLPWVLDPAFIDRARGRAAFARTIITKYPRVIRLNAAEFAALAGTSPAGTASDALRRYALDSLSVIALTGETDFVADGTRHAAVANGHPLMAKITAMGCAGSALLAACLAVESDPWRAAVAGLVILGVAGEMAGAHAAGPGSLAVGIIDAMHAIDRDALLKLARVT